MYIETRNCCTTVKNSAVIDCNIAICSKQLKIQNQGHIILNRKWTEFGWAL